MKPTNDAFPESPVPNRSERPEPVTLDEHDLRRIIVGLTTAASTVRQAHPNLVAYSRKAFQLMALAMTLDNLMANALAHSPEPRFTLNLKLEQTVPPAAPESSTDEEQK